ncbi:hypothetical protein MM239_04890 [Belliella sp. DSM 111904]|uniref:YD repeat-containing protein n=1 Tax=Belliella filtrata TaxID=2923435 RepID=A0ABS9UXP5_9BACT|nr:RHS repeat protein [Belliella filtrata]MCH7408720.1 hypothetical protein [Belliella filtrata]
MPEIIPPSPQAQMIEKFIDFPVDLSSGLPQISLPIYTIKTKEFNFPIQLNYHNSGLKPNSDVSGIVGLGWSLNCVGNVSRIMNQMPDEKHWNYQIPDKYAISSNTNNLVADPDADILDKIARDVRDSELDLFTYNFPSKGGGKFVFERSSQMEAFLKPITLPYSPVKIAPVLGNEQGVIFDYFEITDDEGVLYRYGKSVSSTQSGFREKYFNWNKPSEAGYNSWLLTEIISANKSDTISFEYGYMLNSQGNNGFSKSNQSFSKNVRITRMGGHGEVGQNQYSGTEIKSYLYGYTELRIEKIKFKSGRVEFSYDHSISPQMLDNIKVFSNELSSPIKTVQFSRSQFSESQNKINWYKLDDLTFYDENLVKVNGYSFQYYFHGLPNINTSSIYTPQTYSIDHFGYFNGALNANLMPNFSWNGMVFGGPNIFGSAIRSPNSYYALSGALKSIINVTGGEHTFEYEGNVGKYGNNVGGIRIKNIIDNSNSDIISRNFKYEDSVSEFINQDYFKSHNIVASGGQPLNPEYVFDYFHTSSSPNVDISYNGRPIIYTKVVESYFEGNHQNGKIEHFFNASFISPIIMDTWSIQRGYPWFNAGGPLSLGPLNVFYKNNIFGNVNEYKSLFYDDKGVVVKSIENFYSNDLIKRVKGLKVSRVIDAHQASHLRDKVYFFIFYNNNFDQLSQKLDSAVVKEYFNTEVKEITTSFSYNQNLFKIEESYKNSSGEINKYTYKYPSDFASSGNVYQEMVSKNILSPVIETAEYKEDSFLGAIKTNYHKWGGNIVKPRTVETKKGSNAWENRLRYHDMDAHGNVLSVSKENGTPTSYFWGYSKQYPIAKIENASYAQIASALGTTVSSLKNYTELNLTQLNNLRNVLPGAMVTTYTYDPLIGMTSETDPNGVTTFYEYDSFGRLKTIRDKDGNVLKGYEYNYRNNGN